MAIARIETVLPEPPPKKVILELTEDEAKLVYALCGGSTCPNDDWVPEAVQIRNALQSAGLRPLVYNLVFTQAPKMATNWKARITYT